MRVLASKTNYVAYWGRVALSNFSGDTLEDSVKSSNKSLVGSV